MSDVWKNSIIRYGNENPEQLLANEWNWRIHPQEQQDALKECIEEVGWIQDIIINLRDCEEWGNDRNVPTVLDGHARIKIALRNNQQSVPVKYVNLTPVQEKMALIALDRITNMAKEDSAMLLSIVKSVQDSGEENIPGMDEDEIARLINRAEFASYNGENQSVDDIWQDMPEFEQDDLQPHQTIHVHFTSFEDVQAFGEIIGQKLTERTKYIWYPEQIKEKLIELEYVSK